MEPAQFLKYLLRPTLIALDMHSLSSEKIMMGTPAKESAFGKFIHQHNGPALGMYQIEPATYHDIAVRYLGLRDDLRKKVLSVLGMNKMPDASELMGNAYLSIIIARLRYWMVEEPLPAADDIKGLDAYYKKYYNTEGGASKIGDFEYEFNKYCGDLYV